MACWPGGWGEKKHSGLEESRQLKLFFESMTGTLSVDTRSKHLQTTNFFFPLLSTHTISFWWTYLRIKDAFVSVGHSLLEWSRMLLVLLKRAFGECKWEFMYKPCWGYVSVCQDCKGFPVTPVGICFYSQVMPHSSMARLLESSQLSQVL